MLLLGRKKKERDTVYKEKLQGRKKRQGFFSQRCAISDPLLTASLCSLVLLLVVGYRV